MAGAVCVGPRQGQGEDLGQGCLTSPCVAHWQLACGLQISPCAYHVAYNWHAMFPQILPSDQMYRMDFAQ